MTYKDIQKQHQRVIDSQTGYGNMYLCEVTEPYPIHLKETNTDFISDENLAVLKSMNFITDKDKVSLTDLLMWLPKYIMWMCEPEPQKCSYDFHMLMDYNHCEYDEDNDTEIPLYAFTYCLNVGGHMDYEEYMLLYIEDKKHPAYILSKNPLEAALNLVYWVLEKCINSYGYQVWFRGWYANKKMDNFSAKAVYDMQDKLSKIEPDAYNSNQYFKNLGFIIKNKTGKINGNAAWDGGEVDIKNLE